MAIEVGMKVKAECINGEIYIGTLTHICLGMSSEEPTQASIILEEGGDPKAMTYGNVHIWCMGLKNIEEILESGGKLP